MVMMLRDVTVGGERERFEMKGAVTKQCDTATATVMRSEKAFFEEKDTYFDVGVFRKVVHKMASLVVTAFGG